MPLFPQLGAEYYDDNDKSIKARMESFYAEGITINQAFWSEADTDTRFHAGDQTVYNDIWGNLPANRRRQFNFNRIRRVENMVSGYQRRNRKSTIVVPVENGDEVTADQFTKLMLWNDQQEGVYETISDAFSGALITGLNFLHVWVDYRSDPVSGNIKVDNCPYNSFLVDPYWKKHDLSDCNSIWKRSYLTKRECISLLPNKSEDIAGLFGNDSSRDGKFQFLPESYNYGMKNLLTYDEFYYRDYRTQKVLADTQTGETMEWRSDDQEGLRYFLSLYPQVTILESEIPTVRLAILVQGKLMYDGPNPLGIDSYPFVPVFAYFHPEMPYYPWRIQGIVRGLRDAQYLYNRRKVIELDILESQVNSGFIYKENALINPKDVFQSGQGKGIALKEEAQVTDVIPIVAPQIPPSMIQLSEILAKEIQEISGVNEELLGSAVDEKAGVLAMLRQGAGLTTLQTLFDNLDRSQKLLGKLRLEIMQANFAPGKVSRIIEDKPSPQFYNKAFGRYDAAVEEGFNTTTQKQMQLIQLTQLKELGVPVPNDVMLEACTIQNKSKLIEAIKLSDQSQQQMQQMQMQVQMEELKARTELAHSRAVADQGLGLERLSRIDENKQLANERRAQAIKDEESGLLDLVKAIKELQGMDVDALHKIVQMHVAIKASNQPLQGSSPAGGSIRPKQAQARPMTKDKPKSTLKSKVSKAKGV